MERGRERDGLSAKGMPSRRSEAVRTGPRRRTGPLLQAILVGAFGLGSLAGPAQGGGLAPGDPEAPGGPVYRVAPPDAEMDALRSARQARAALRDSLSLAARERHAEDQRLKKLEARQLRLDWRGIDKPPGPEAFAAAFHFPPRAQYATGTCWAFSATSFIESEVERLNGRRVKLSEMWLVYWEYVEKARRFVREYGRSAFGEGSQDHALQDIYARYGAVPADAYRGCPDEEGRHDHTELAERLDALLSWVEERACWEEALVVDLVRSLLDEYLGVPPEVFDYEGRTHTPPDFLRDVLALDLDAYVSVVSTLREPFGEWTLLDVHDNWRRREDFLNLPLPEFYRVLREAAREGCTAVLGVDVSEPGMDGLEDAAVVPSWDIPAEFIDQFSRELRIANRATTDDHGNHCVGHLAWGGRDWFLIKDSNRSSRQGRFPGYAFYDGDYIRLKALCFTVHRDRLAGLLPEAPPPR